MHSNIEKRTRLRSISQRYTRVPLGDFPCVTMGSASIPSTRRKSLAYSNDSTGITAGPGSAWLFASGSSPVMADESGSNPHPGKEQPSSSPSQNEPLERIRQPLNLLLAEDNLPD